MRAAPVRILRRDVPPHGPWPDSVAPALQRIYAARGVATPAEGELKLARLLPPNALGHLPEAAALLADAIAAAKHIVVVGGTGADSFEIVVMRSFAGLASLSNLTPANARMCTSICSTNGRSASVLRGR